MSVRAPIGGHLSANRHVSAAPDSVRPIKYYSGVSEFRRSLIVLIPFSEKLGPVVGAWIIAITSSLLGLGAVASISGRN